MLQCVFCMNKSVTLSIRLTRDERNELEDLSRLKGATPTHPK